MDPKMLNLKRGLIKQDRVPSTCVFRFGLLCENYLSIGCFRLILFPVPNYGRGPWLVHFADASRVSFGGELFKLMSVLDIRLC